MEKKWHGSNSQLKLFSSPKTESNGSLVSWLTQLCIYPRSFPHQKKKLHISGLIILTVMARGPSDRDLASSKVQTNCLLSKFILVNVTFCFSVSITVYVKKTQNKTKPIEMTTLDYKCIYNKIWIFPPVDCNHNFNYSVPHCFLYLSCTLHFGQ